MPKTKIEDLVYTIIMVIVMVYAMVCYNMALNMGGMNNEIFLMALKELPIMCPIAFLLEFLFVGRVCQKITFSVINPKDTAPIFIVVLISSLIVAFMCPLMSLFATLLFKDWCASNIVATWLETTIFNFPMALLWQLLYAGPLVRFIFRKIYRRA